ncbi:ATP-binding cassette domain-containing protein [Aeromicrobium sp. SMF47]|uniref:ATP-binding cassette domain-containing protein n=1 Tax=Aeromicrobium yanjiei TaxID=2662028 RepID=A0A5Q2MP89_9ACTN|nr:MULTISPECIES: ABC transporter ATP-binding protein [Aeromicrobium]MRJ75670.1 ATP-binding cassette domain-containing protein [Aeromicrobium yanjiei]MRK00015.1 ATP-binding cassette domain-containing protein [Aeromicrobium sp. S22]QGG43072.1 ATP-binding cassette domain-containing protein [Aeromicrobium yanjiei]
MSDSLLAVRGLTAGYGGAPVLQGIDLDVAAGTIVAVVGANGAGKTTLLRALCGTIPVSAGTVTWDGDPLRGTRTEDLVRRGIAHVPEGRGVITELTVEENLRLGHVWRKDKADGRRATDEVYEMFEPLTRRRRSAGHQLSGGERQMLAIGRALVARPRLMMLDEPSLGLAPKVSAQIMALLKRRCDETGLTVLLVEQNVRSAMSIADHGVVLSLGRVVASDSADRIAADDDLRHAYLGF